MIDLNELEDVNLLISDDDRGYFAAKRGELCVRSLFEKIDNWYLTLRNNGYFSKIIDLYVAWHGGSYGDLEDSHSIRFGGEDGELTEIKVNHLRNVGEYIINMTTTTRPSLEARAVNSDFKSQVQTKLANGLLDYYVRDCGLEKYFKNACVYAVACASGWIKVGWNANKGRVVNQREIIEANRKKIINPKIKVPAPEYEGDVEFFNLSPFDVIEDINKENEDHDWRIARTFKNKYDLIAAYPEYAEQIMNIQSTGMLFDRYFNFNHLKTACTDDIPIFEFYHRPTESLPDGRYILFVSEDAILYDGPLPYRRIPLFSMKPSRILGTPLGYTVLFDVLPIQDAADMLYSTILSNQAAFGVQNILMPTGCNIEPSQLAGGLNVLSYNPQQGKPEALQLTSTAPETFNLLNMMINSIETISGINSAIRGNPEASLRSAQAIAMIESNAIQFMSGLQSEYIKLMENVGICTIEILVDYAESPRIASIVGESDAPYTKEFKGIDLADINRVVVDVANPLTKTIAGRVNMADNLLQYQQISAQQYMNIINTGKLEVGTDSIIHEQMLIKAENESLVRGDTPIALSIDQHMEHIKGHRGVLGHPSLRRDKELVQKTLDHIMEHINLLRSTDPELLTVLGEQPLSQGPDQAPPEEGGMDGAVPQPVESLTPEMQASQGVGGRAQNVTLPQGLDEVLPSSIEEQFLELAQGS